MFNIFKKEETEKENSHPSIIAVACLLIHSARIDENYTNKEKKIIKDAIIEMGADASIIDKIIIDAEQKEKDSNQILDFTREIKNIEPTNPILIDCLTLWLSNHLLKKNDLEKKIDELADVLENSKSNIVLVSSEVGTGIVPDNALARKFRDNAGLMNQKIASVSDQVYWVVAGIPTQIK